MLFESGGERLVGDPDPAGLELLQQGEVLRVVEPLVHAPGDLWTDLGDVVDLLAIVRFEGSARLIGLLTARGLRVKLFDSLPGAIAALRTVRTAVLVVRTALEPDSRDAITFVIRNFESLGARTECFHDRFAEFFSGPVEPERLSAAISRHAMASDAADRGCRGHVA